MKKHITEPLVAIPVVLDIYAHLATYPPTKIEKFDLVKLLKFLGLLTSVPAKKLKLIDAEGKVPLHSKLLQKIANNYKSYLDYLVRTRIIVRDNFYNKEGMETIMNGRIKKNKGHCKSYRFHQKYQTEVVYIPLPVKKTATKTTVKNSWKTDGKDVYPFLYSWFAKGKLNIDLEGAERYFLTFTGLDQEPDNYMARMKFNAYLHPLRLLKYGKGNFTFTVDDKGKRLHTPLTYMKKEAKQFVTFGKTNKKLVSLDLKNSQPFLLLALLRHEFYRFDSEMVETLEELQLDMQQDPSEKNLKLVAKQFRQAATKFYLRYSSKVNVLPSGKGVKGHKSSSSMSFNTPFNIQCITEEHVKVIKHLLLNKGLSMSSTSSSIMLMNMFSKTGNNAFTSQPEDILSYSQGVTDSTFYPNLKGKFEEGLGIVYEDMQVGSPGTELEFAL